MSLEKFIKQHQEAFDDQQMPENAAFDFEARLKKELHTSNRVKRLKTIRYVSMAATLVLLLSVGYFYVDQQKKLEIRDNLVLALEEEQTNSSRLQTIYEIEDNVQYQKEDEKILHAFFKILKEDSDANSKVAVIEALLKFPDNPQVRSSLIDALGAEKEPLVQLKLIKSIATLREQRAKAPLQKIIDNKESLPLVKGNASELLAMLNQ
ncbi:HEAT repeat-containing protein [Kordia sp. SMS9]|uniref:HEAT repeat domain-containing protein n=1 Tax=Kordia sp. SMS9 TaxID=2282170 RepID=UPI000E0DC0E3|nr:HEAT repeat domain-containing protein [Kordia sp. SMS9]AXG68160.1 HEAT repeat-containing protein [Kordia sp. SMS9]